jgi:uncharacterized protein (DUF2141 family)
MNVHRAIIRSKKRQGFLANQFYWRLICCVAGFACLAPVLVFSQTKEASVQQPQPTGTIEVPIVKIRHLQKGQLYVALYEKIKRIELDLERALSIQKSVPKSRKMKFTFKNIPHGEYAVGVFHDYDGDNKLDAIFGFPREDMAVSRNASGGPLGAPKWSEAKFKLDRPKIVLEPLKMYPFGPDD